MRGREPEWHILGRLLSAAEHGGGGTLLIEGEPGTGKTLLLAEAAAHASRRGFTLATGSVERMSPERLGTRALEYLRVRLARGAPGRPVLVSLDDLQRADSATLATLRALHRDLGCRRLVWLLSRSVTTAGRPCPATRAGVCSEHLFQALESHGATRLALRPLPEEAVAAVAADVLGAVPDPGLLSFAAGAGGNPFLLVELLRGLREEGAVEVRGGRARLPRPYPAAAWHGGESPCPPPEPPERVRAAVRSRLRGLSREGRQLVEVAAVLGSRFSPEDVGDLVGTGPAALLPAVEEVLDAGLLLAAGDTLEFRHELVWRAVLRDLPAAMRNALHHQAGRLLLGRGGAAARAAGHLVEGARPGDTRALADLDRAVTEVRATAPGAAADLAVQAVELSDSADPRRPARVVTAVEAATEAGRLADAERLARSTPARTTSPAAAELHCALSGVLLPAGRPAEAVAEAEAALRERALPAPWRERATLGLLYGLSALPDRERAEREAVRVLADAGRHGEAAEAAATAVLGTIWWESGRLAEGLRAAREAVGRADDAGDPEGRACTRLALAAMLTDVRLLDEARAVIGEAAEEDESPGHDACAAAEPPGHDAWAAGEAPGHWATGEVPGHGPWAAGAAALSARAELAAGHAEDAAARASRALDLVQATGARLSGAVAAAVLATVALRRGDLRAAERHADGDDGWPLQAGTAACWCAMAAAQVVEARDGPAAALERLGPLYAGVRERPGLLVADPAAAPWLVRVALAAGDRPGARLTVASAERLAEGAPGFPTVRTAATHARGLLEGDAEALEPAVKEGVDPWARASAAEDLGVTLEAAGDRRACVRSLDQALAGYQECGAARDAARLRRRLRRLGVRHRHWATTERPVTGWASLTDTERTVSLLVTQGWTNRRVAEQMFISVHTVAFHLRQIFRKLGIGSRVELTRLMLERHHHQEATDGTNGADRPE
ncbi:LuxR C-terminal-related transcriptional regulator [Sphaerisporangium sp. NPDC005288]|uniref:helix-turn-helix transcriptional regulator n=1 Tax=Sphaerisporangium sp. NPDC005288 TaxID=3155114 RepID=UPI0033B3369A